jgi:hypothetical protein
MKVEVVGDWMVWARATHLCPVSYPSGRMISKRTGVVPVTLTRC